MLRPRGLCYNPQRRGCGVKIYTSLSYYVDAIWIIQGLYTDGVYSYQVYTTSAAFVVSRFTLNYVGINTVSESPGM